jgi:Flp pilus assembly pilin Flp
MREHGQSVVDHGLMIALVALVVLIGTQAFGQQILPWLTSLAGRITTIGT